MARLIGISEIARRLNVTRVCAWRRAKEGRFGAHVGTAGKMLWVDDPCLGNFLAMCPVGTRPKSAISARIETNHVARLNKFAKGEKFSDAEDYQLAGELLMIAARNFERRQQGIDSPALLSARTAVNVAMTKTRKDKPEILLQLRSVAAQLLARGGSADS